MKKALPVSIKRERLHAFCRHHHVSRLALYGSVLNEDFDENSDIDVLVEFEPDHVPGYFRLLDMEEQLSGILGGRVVDLRTPNELSRYFREDVMRDARTEYVAT